jgi:hypothetical protein
MHKGGTFCWYSTMRYQNINKEKSVSYRILYMYSTYFSCPNIICITDTLK